MIKFFPPIFALIFCSSVLVAGADAPAGNPRLVVHLLDYLARDYAGAVQGGKVISESEYLEQLEFSETVVKAEAQVQYPASASGDEVKDVNQRIESLRRMILNKADPSAVAEASGQIRARVIRLSGMTTTPAQTPDLSRGRELFSQRCASCHGSRGYGDGPASTGLDPKPINFHDAKTMNEIAPLQVFHAVRLGVQGTAMVPQADLSDQDTWNVAYFALSFYDGGSGNTLDVARGKLKKALESYLAKNFDTAQEAALAAYLEGFEPIEPKLKASDPSFVEKIEGQMMLVRQTIDHRDPADQVKSTISGALSALDEAGRRMSQSEMSPWMAFSAAAAVLVREGFEAVLVVLAFLGVVRTSGNKRAEAWLHGGWVLALGLGVVAWFFSGWLIGISGAERETMEAVTAFFAAAVLLFVGFWLHQKTEIKRWTAFVQDKVSAALEKKSLIGLASISFIAVFRECLETVLFLRAIWVDCGPAARTGMFLGVVISFIGTFALAWASLSLSQRIPIRKLFSISSSVMAALAVVLIGKGIHSLQETGALSITGAPIPVSSEFFGVFPTWETLICQLLAVALIALLWNLNRRRDFRSDRTGVVS